MERSIVDCLFLVVLLLWNETRHGHKNSPKSSQWSLWCDRSFSIVSGIRCLTRSAVLTSRDHFALVTVLIPSAPPWQLVGSGFFVSEICFKAWLMTKRQLPLTFCSSSKSLRQQQTLVWGMHDLALYAALFHYITLHLLRRLIVSRYIYATPLSPRFTLLPNMCYVDWFVVGISSSFQIVFWKDRIESLLLRPSLRNISHHYKPPLIHCSKPVIVFSCSWTSDWCNLDCSHNILQWGEEQVRDSRVMQVYLTRALSIWSKCTHQYIDFATGKCSSFCFYRCTYFSQSLL